MKRSSTWPGRLAAPRESHLLAAESLQPRDANGAEWSVHVAVLVERRRASRDLSLRLALAIAALCSRGLPSARRPAATRSLRPDVRQTSIDVLRQLLQILVRARQATIAMVSVATLVTACRARPPVCVDAARSHRELSRYGMPVIARPSSTLWSSTSCPCTEPRRLKRCGGGQACT